jgi:YVTN family beta-propeller protein
MKISKVRVSCARLWPVLLLGMGLFSASSGQTHLPTLKATIPVGGETRWDLLTVDSAAQRLYVSHGMRTEVIDLKTDKVLAPILNTPRVHGIALAPEQHRGFISCGGDSSVAVFDLKTDSILARISAGGSNPDVIIYEPFTKQILCFNGRSDEASVIDPRTLKVIGKVELGGKPEFAVSDGGGRVYVNLEDKSKVVVFDPKTYKILAEWSLTPGEEPTGIALDKQNHRLFSACGNQNMTVINTDSGKVIATLPIGKGPDGAAFDPATHRAFSSNREGTLTVIREDNPDKFSVEGTVTTMPSARTMALDMSTHRLFLPTKASGDSATVAKEGLKILVYEQ